MAIYRLDNVAFAVTDGVAKLSGGNGSFVELPASLLAGDQRDNITSITLHVHRGTATVDVAPPAYAIRLQGRVAARERSGAVLLSHGGLLVYLSDGASPIEDALCLDAPVTTDVCMTTTPMRRASSKRRRDSVA
jgi:hypothetical protein